MNELRGGIPNRHSAARSRRSFRHDGETAPRTARFLARRGPFWTRLSWRLELAAGGKPRPPFLTNTETTPQFVVTAGDQIAIRDDTDMTVGIFHRALLRLPRPLPGQTRSVGGLHSKTLDNPSTVKPCPAVR